HRRVERRRRGEDARAPHGTGTPAWSLHSATSSLLLAAPASRVSTRRTRSHSSRTRSATLGWSLWWRVRRGSQLRHRCPLLAPRLSASIAAPDREMLPRSDRR